VRYGYVTPNSWGLRDPRQVVELAVRAEDLGVDSLWVSHHVLHRGFIGERLGDLPYYDPLTMLGVLATATTRARLGVSVLVLPYLHPMPTAKALATIDYLSEGRLDVGVGVGGVPEEHEAIAQVPWNQRGAYADEFLEVVRLLWTPGPSSFDGTFFSFTDLEAYPGPFDPQGVPILVGGHVEASLHRAVRFGAGWQAVGFEPDQVAASRARLHELLRAAGRPVEGFRIEVRLHLGMEDLDVPSWQDRFDAYESAGVDQLVLAPQTGDIEVHERWLDALAPLLG
jgi:probable F420-dependent oxidoreductase